jgi:hypothetical protein
VFFRFKQQGGPHFQGQSMKVAVLDLGSLFAKIFKTSTASPAVPSPVAPSSHPGGTAIAGSMGPAGSGAGTSLSTGVTVTLLPSLARDCCAPRGPHTPLQPLVAVSNPRASATSRGAEAVGSPLSLPGSPRVTRAQLQPQPPPQPSAQTATPTPAPTPSSGGCSAAGSPGHLVALARLSPGPGGVWAAMPSVAGFGGSTVSASPRVTRQSSPGEREPSSWMAPGPGHKTQLFILPNIGEEWASASDSEDGEM